MSETPKKKKRGYQWRRKHLRNFSAPPEPIGHRVLPCCLCGRIAWWVVERKGYCAEHKSNAYDAASRAASK